MGPFCHTRGLYCTVPVFTLESVTHNVRDLRREGEFIQLSHGVGSTVIFILLKEVESLDSTARLPGFSSWLCDLLVV